MRFYLLAPVALTADALHAVADALSAIVRRYA